MSTTDHIVRLYIHDVRERFGWVRRLAERAMAQLTDDEFMTPGDVQAGNPVAAIVKHLAGCMRSRWTDFLTTDGEKESRDREDEFAVDGDTRGDLMARWDEAWRLLLQSLEGLTHADLAQTVKIRGEPHSVPAAINRSLVHTSYHVGQIVQLAKAMKGPDWETLSIPPGGTDDYDRRMRDRFSTS